MIVTPEKEPMLIGSGRPGFGDRDPRRIVHRNPEASPQGNSYPGLIASSDPAGGQLIPVWVAADGSKFQVQIGPDGPKREFASR